MWDDGVLINLMGGILSKSICLSNHIVHFKHLTILYVNHTSTKLKKKKEEAN